MTLELRLNWNQNVLACVAFSTRACAKREPLLVHVLAHLVGSDAFVFIIFKVRAFASSRLFAHILVPCFYRS